MSNTRSLVRSALGLIGAVLAGCNAEVTPVSSPASEQGAATPAEEIPGVPLPKGGISVFEPGIEAHRQNRGPDARCAEFEIVSGAGTGFEEAVRVRVLEPLPEHAWYAQLSTPVLEDLQAGQVYLLSLWARAAASDADDGRGEFLIYLGTPGDENTLPVDAVEPAIYQKVKVGQKWQQLLLPVQLTRDYEKLRTSVNLDLGFRIQTLEFAGIQLRRHAELRVEDLPATNIEE